MSKLEDCALNKQGLAIITLHLPSPSTTCCMSATNLFLMFLLGCNLKPDDLNPELYFFNLKKSCIAFDNFKFCMIKHQQQGACQVKRKADHL